MDSYLIAMDGYGTAGDGRGGQGLLGKLKHPLGGGRRRCLGTYACSKCTSMLFFCGPPLDVLFLAHTRVVVLSQICLPLLGLGLGQGHTIALHKGKHKKSLEQLHHSKC